MNEAIPGFEFPTWIGLVAPPGLSADVRDKLLRTVHDVMHDRDIVKRFGDNAFDVVNSTPQAFAERVRKDSALMADFVKRRIVTAD